MAGISSKALNFGGHVNKEKTFQGQRFDDDLGLNWVQFKWRNHDPQIGRFIEIDPLAEDYEYNSTYAFSENKVVVHVELEGLESFHINFNNIHDDKREELKRDFHKGVNQGLEKATPIVVVGLLLLTPGPDELLVAGLFSKGYRTYKAADKVNDSKKAIDKLDDLKDLAKGLDNEKGQLKKSKNSFENLIKEHKEKLDEFKKDPVGKSDPKLLEGKSKEVQQKIMDGRIKALEKQIKKQEGELNKINQKLNETNKQIENINKQINGTQ